MPGLILSRVFSFRPLSVLLDADKSLCESRINIFGLAFLNGV